MRKFRFALTFDAVYRHPYFLQVILYWNYVPFFAYLLIYLSTNLVHNQLLQLAIGGFILVLNIAYQLYLWSFSFFTAQDVSMGKLGVPEYSLRDILTDWGVKFRLAIIRLGYYSPLVLIAILFVYLGGLNLLAGAVLFFSLDGADFKLLLLLLLGGLLYLLIESYLLPAALYQYSYRNKLLAAFNLKAVFSFISRNFADLTILMIISVVMSIVFAVIGLIVSSLALAIPIIGVIVLSLYTGFNTSWYTVFIPNLYGQIWQATDLD